MEKKDGIVSWLTLAITAASISIGVGIGWGMKTSKIDSIQESLCTVQVDLKKTCEEVHTLKEFVAAQKVMNDAMSKRLDEIYAAVKEGK